MRIIRSIYTDQKIIVRGVLVGHDKGGFEETHNRIEVRTWSDVLIEARNLHLSYLQSLLLASDPGASDVRLQQIADFGGKETMELLARLAPVGDFPPIITDALHLLDSATDGSGTLVLPASSSVNQEHD